MPVQVRARRSYQGEPVTTASEKETPEIGRGWAWGITRAPVRFVLRERRPRAFGRSGLSRSRMCDPTKREGEDDT